MYNNAKELLSLTLEGGKIAQVVLDNECQIGNRTRDEVLDETQRMLEVMIQAAEAGLERAIPSVSGLSGGDAQKVERYRDSHVTLAGDTVSFAMARALSSSEVNASMGRIVAAPTAGSCGIVPGAILTAAERLGLEGEEWDRKLVEALLTASGIGQIIAHNATLSGAEGGCQAECGAAAAMAAAAVVEMAGGSPQASFHAASIALMNVLGLVCDPVAGLVEIPCAYRNASGVVGALSASDMALAGVESPIPFDEVVEAMYRIGRAMPAALRETAMGGLATTPTGQRLAQLLVK